MNTRSKVLVVDDEPINRKLLKKILSRDYDVIEAGDGQEALHIMQHQTPIAAVILDLIMPGMGGMEFLELYAKDEQLRRTPVIVSTGEGSSDREVNCLKLGAWDFIAKPYHAGVIRFRVKNVIERSELEVLKELQYVQQFDSLTGLYKRDKFVQCTEKLLKEHPEEKYLLIYFDICKFQTYNAIFGIEEGDHLLQYIGTIFRERAKEKKDMVFGREDADVFLICQPYEEQSKLQQFFRQVQKKIREFKPNYNAILNFGVYPILEREVEVLTMIDRAKLASRVSKGNYIKNYAYYTNNLEEDILKEQEIVNSMDQAMERQEFVLYLQPKYGLKRHAIEGAEVLVRWKKEDGTLIPPSDFISIFEKNAFIMELDYYIWEHSCQLLRGWLNEGRKPLPISVNISRISLYNPRLVEEICDLVERYQIPPALFQLELTESAYTSDPVNIKDAMRQLQDRGFTILMDDFGSGYSSLNVLKDIAVDILKIDMKFMEKGEYPGRCENILASVVRMAKWLRMPVIAEGVETSEQVAFLQSIGCEFVQGYYFAKPMPPEEYEMLAFSAFNFREAKEQGSIVSTENLWNSAAQMELLFSNMLQAVGVYEYENGEIDVVRANQAYYDLLETSDQVRGQEKIADAVVSADKKRLQRAFEIVVKEHDATECEVKRHTLEGKRQWIHVKLKYINRIGEKHILFAILTDITMQKEIDYVLQKKRMAQFSKKNGRQTVLLVEDNEGDQIALRTVFAQTYHILEAKSSAEALEVIKKSRCEIALILLDLHMPKDAALFLQRRSKDSRMQEIPVVVMTEETGKETQMDYLNLGAMDCILKPFVPEQVAHRVAVVLESEKRFEEVLRRYEKERGPGKRDRLTGLYTKESAKERIEEILKKYMDENHVLVLFRVDNLEELKESCGKSVVHQALRSVAICLNRSFRQTDILCRYKKDTFIVFIRKIPGADYVQKRSYHIVHEVRSLLPECEELECHVGFGESEGLLASFSGMMKKAEQSIAERREQEKLLWS